MLYPSTISSGFFWNFPDRTNQRRARIETAVEELMVEMSQKALLEYREQHRKLLE
ncbi:MAG: hypothetical protein GY820_08285 [Gammaproteobacteria bacterium]|nr:hypothetical protein [Gammaproteobacteria bacterium]